MSHAIASFTDLPDLANERLGGAAVACSDDFFADRAGFDRDGRAAFSVIGECEWNGPQARDWLAPLLARRT